MGVRLAAVTFRCLDPAAVRAFWEALLEGHEQPGFELRFVAADEPKRGQNQAHVDLTSTSYDDQRATVDRVLALGGRHADVGQSAEETHVVLADVEGNELCVIAPGNNFLAGCGFVGALACDGSRETGVFWAEALGWPLVWDQDEETAIQSPAGGTKINWGGPPYNPRLGPERVVLDLEADDVEAEAERLASLGATQLRPGVLADPDGHEFLLSAS